MSKTVAHQDDVETSSMDSAFLGVVEARQGSTAWKAKLFLLGSNTEFKLDTGAEVTAISNQTFQKLSGKPPLSKPRKRLFGPGQSALNVLGEFQGELLYEGRSSRQAIYVVKI